MRTIASAGYAALMMTFAALAGGYASPLHGESLHSAAKNGATAEVKKLLEEGAEINKTDRQGFAPLSLAAMNGHADTVALLLDKGARVDAVDETKFMAGPSLGQTALMLAAAGGHAAVVKVLIARGANIHLLSRSRRGGLFTASRSGQTALELAQQGGHADCVTLLKQAVQDESHKQLAGQHAAQLEGERTVRESALGRRINPDTLMAEERTADDALQAGKFNEALEHFTTAIHAAPTHSAADERLRKKIIQAYLALTPPPPVPEDATHHALRGKAFVELAQDAVGYNKALFELEQAVEIAPWFADAYFNLGLIEEKVNDYSGAIRSLNLYLYASPQSPDAAAVRQKIIKLEVKQELKESK